MPDSTTAPPLPAAVPSIGTVLGHGWHLLWKSFWKLLLAGVVVLAISWGFSWLLSGTLGVGLVGTNGSWYSSGSLRADFASVAGGALAGYVLLVIIAQFLFYNHLYVGLAGQLLSAARGRPVEIGGIFRPFGNYWQVALALALPFGALLVGAAVVALVMLSVTWLGLFLLLLFWVAAVVVACKLAFLPFLLVDRRLRAADALRAAWRLTNDYATDIFIIWLPLLVYAIVVYGIMLVAVIAVSGMANAMASSAVVPVLGIVALVLVLGVFGLLGTGIMTMWLGTATAWLYDMALRRTGPHEVAEIPDAGAGGAPEA